MMTQEKKLSQSDEEFTLKVRALVKEYYPYNTGHKIEVNIPKHV